jgi:hypothetical protein
MEFNNVFNKTDSFSPTVNLSTFFIILGISSFKKYKISVNDITNAFLNALLPPEYENKIYAKLDSISSNIIKKYYPEYEKFLDKNGNIYVALRKSLYGISIAPVNFFNHLKNTFINILNFKQSLNDSCCFYKKSQFNTNDEYVYAIIYVDDIMLSGPDEKEIEQIKQELTQVYGKLKSNNLYNSGDIVDYIGVQIKANEDWSFTLSQTGLIKNIIETYNVKGKAVTPSTPDIFALDTFKKSKEVNRHFLSLLMKLYFVGSRTRPDILCALNFLSTRSFFASKKDYQKLYRIAKYLSNTQDLALTIKPTNLILECLVDSSFNTNSDSTAFSGIICAFGLDNYRPTSINFISCKKQAMISRSSTESEIIGIESALTHIIWTRHLLEELGIHQIEKTPIHNDNKSSLSLLSQNDGDFSNNKHFIRRLNLIKEQMKLNKISVHYCPTDELTPDLLTKHIGGKKFRYLRNKLLNIKTQSLGEL